MRTHGKAATYTAGCRCEDCREAARLRVVERREQASANGGIYPGNITHGGNGYVNYGCRCQTCRDGHAANTRRMWAERRAKTAFNDGVAPTLTHGAATYNNWGCRCDVCRAADSARRGAP